MGGGGQGIERVDCFRQGDLPLREYRGFYHVDVLISVGQEIPGWFKIPLLREAETEIRLGIKSWWGLAKVAPL